MLLPTPASTSSPQARPSETKRAAFAAVRAHDACAANVAISISLQLTSSITAVSAGLAIARNIAVIDLTGRQVTGGGYTGIVYWRGLFIAAALVTQVVGKTGPLPFSSR